MATSSIRSISPQSSSITSPTSPLIPPTPTSAISIATSSNTSSTLWRDCVQWFIRCGILDKTHRVTSPHSDLLDFAQTLRDGVLLCNVTNRLSKGSVDVRELSLRPQLSQFLCLKNICLFLTACKTNFDLKPGELFDSAELYRLTDFGKVLQTLSKLSKTPVALRSGVLGFPTSAPQATPDHQQHPDYYNNEIYRDLAEVAESHELEEETYDQLSDDEKDKIYDHIVIRSSKAQKEEEFKPTDPRGHCIKELLDTERNYVDALNMLLQRFVTPLRDVLSPDDHQIMFINLSELAQIHAAFQSELRQATKVSLGQAPPLSASSSSTMLNGHSQSVDSPSSSTNSLTQQRIGDVFVKWKPKLVSYSAYCSELPRAQARIEQLCGENSSIRSKITECQTEANGNKFRLQDLLSLPMQRVLKYHLLLKELLKHTPSTHDDRSSVQSGLDSMLDLSLYINEVKRDCETRQVIRDIQSSIVDLHMPENTELCDYGRLLRDGDVKILAHSDRDKKGKMRYVFVFDKVLMICKQVKSNQYSYKNALILDDYRIEDNENNNKPAVSLMTLSKQFNYSFSLVGRKGENVYIMAVKSKEMKEHWIQAINTAHDNVSPAASHKLDHAFLYFSFDVATECDVCGKLLRGLFFQGYKCTTPGCGVCVHKECISQSHGCGQKFDRSNTTPSRRTGGGLGAIMSAKRTGSFDQSRHIVVAIKSFQGNNGGPDYLSFNEHDVIEVISMDVGMQGWWSGRVLRGDNIGRFGLLPCDHVRLAGKDRNTTALTRPSSFEVPFQFGRPNSFPPRTSPSGGSLNGGGANGSSSLPPYVNLDDLRQHPWYVGKMERVKAETFLKGFPTGTFLIRYSSTQDKYVISVSYGSEVKHVKVERTENDTYFLDTGRYFGSLVELATFYQDNSLKESFTTLDTTLKYPVSTLIVGYAIALHNFQATAPNMISLRREDFVIIVNKRDSERGWWKGKVDDKIGYFPLAYVQELETGATVISS